MIRVALEASDDLKQQYLALSPRLNGGQIVEYSDADAVLIEADTDAHSKFACQAAAAGKHVLISTPVASTVSDADSVIEACQSAGVRLMIGQHLRFHPSIAQVKECLESDKLGEPGLLRIHRWETETITNGLSRIAPELDLALWMFGGPATNIYAVGFGDSKQAGVQIHLGFAGGGMAIIDYAGQLPANDGYYSLTMIGSTGAAYADDHHNMQLHFSGQQTSAVKASQDEVGRRNQLQEFIDAIEQNREPAITGAEGRLAVQVSTAAIESMKAERAMTRAGDIYDFA